MCIRDSPIIVNETKWTYSFFLEFTDIKELSFIMFSILALVITFLFAWVISTYIEAPLYRRGKDYANMEIVLE